MEGARSLGINTDCHCLLGLAANGAAGNLGRGHDGGHSDGAMQGGARDCRHEGAGSE